VTESVEHATEHATEHGHDMQFRVRAGLLLTVVVVLLAYAVGPRQDLCHNSSLHTPRVAL